LEQGGCESPPYMRSSQRHSVTLRTPSFLSVCSPEILHNESVPFPRTSGARFCGAGLFVFVSYYIRAYMYTLVQKKCPPFYFWNNSVKNKLIFDNFWYTDSCRILALVDFKCCPLHHDVWRYAILVLQARNDDDNDLTKAGRVM